MKSENTPLTANSIFTRYVLKSFCIIWGVIIMIPLVYFPAPSALTGHPWKVELVFSFVISIVLAGYLLKYNGQDVLLPSKIFYWIVTPCCAFILWSAVSIFWADSISSVTHHTLVWVGYLVFFILAVQIVSSKKFLLLFVLSLSIVIGIIAALCVIEYTFTEQIGEVFGFRYARFAEIHATLLPLLLSFTLRLKGKKLYWSVTLVCFVWLAILFSMSRGAFISSIVGLSIFISLRFFSKPPIQEKKRLVIAIFAIVLIACLTQISIFDSNAPKVTTFNRLTVESDEDKSNSFSNNIRLLFGNVAFEMVKNNPVNGVGADNFGSEFNKYRRTFSANEKNRYIAEQQEFLLPERAHNEYLQILAELGIIGIICFLFLIFGIFKLCFYQFKESRSDPSSIFIHSSFAGITTFLVSSFFSSFSFRLMQNGLVFFFLVALLLRGFLRNKSLKQKRASLPLINFKLAPVKIALFLCLSLLAFSVLKASSQYFVYRAEHQSNFALAKSDYEKAILLDKANGSANYSYGLRLIQENQFKAASSQLQEAIHKGLNTSVCYSYLIMVQSLEGNHESTLSSIKEALAIFPFSTFMRVRYALFLKQIGKNAEASEEFETAKKLNKKQAESWWLLMNSGQEVLVKTSNINKEITGLDNLIPIQGVPVVILEREIKFPEEKIKFNFEK